MRESGLVVAETRTAGSGTRVWRPTPSTTLASLQVPYIFNRGLIMAALASQNTLVDVLDDENDSPESLETERCFKDPVWDLVRTGPPDWIPSSDMLHDLVDQI